MCASIFLVLARASSLTGRLDRYAQPEALDQLRGLGRVDQRILELAWNARS